MVSPSFPSSRYRSCIPLDASRSSKMTSSRATEYRTSIVVKPQRWRGLVIKTDEALVIGQSNTLCLTIVIQDGYNNLAIRLLVFEVLLRHKEHPRMDCRTVRIIEG